MPYDRFGNWHPSRRSEHRCSVCLRHFAAHAVPAPMADGSRICRDCRPDYYSRLASSAA